MRERASSELRLTVTPLCWQTPRTDWVRQWPAMVIIAVNSIIWSIAVEDAINGGKVPGFLDRSIGELMDLTDLVRGKLSSQERNTLGALITIDVHARDVIQGLVDSNVAATTDFEWVSQLRYYWRDDVQVRDWAPGTDAPSVLATAV